MPGWSENRKEYWKDFSLAKFIAEDRCVVCGSANTYEKTPEGEAEDKDYPLVSTVKEFFFIVCPECRLKVSDGLCITCWNEKEYKDGKTDFIYLDIAQHLSKEIIRLRSELTKWIPKIQSFKKKTDLNAQYGIVGKPTKKSQTLFRKKV